ncbi:OmpA family protein [Flavobacterium agrisoli]|uniref:OmpA family protein n=1 Tax=Flavobacterium agrisoli TaxID=2793066 RepID=A0A934UI80_9FLAO|nr:OmpA family protein [Flavobacterium agrisoli]MBK0368566.1 OmpA family protein [Flavobacterium agrisoli]
MKKTITSLSVLLLSFAAQAQTATESEMANNNDYNHWSIELNGGLNKPFRTFTPGYYTESISPWHGDVGVRYMFNPKFGLKLDYGYDQFSEADTSLEFDSRYMRLDLQGVVNLGRTLNFETWTNTLSLLAHGGFGVGQLTADDGFDGEDYTANAIMGLTGQIRLGNRVALTGDLSGIMNLKQNQNFDGMSRARTSGVDGVILNASVGLTFYLGKNEKHADWVVEADKYSDFDRRLSLVETGLVDSDKDGVADLYDLEPNSIAGVAVNTKGQSIDNNQNGVPDELESYLQSTYGQNNSAANGTVEELINDGYVNVYFDFNSSKPTNASLSGVDFLVKYMKNNPSSTAEIIGYADEIGNSDYNQQLSQKRAEAVKSVVTQAGIDASRLTVSGNGEDTSVNKNSAEARQIVRRVTFKVKN